MTTHRLMTAAAAKLGIAATASAPAVVIPPAAPGATTEGELEVVAVSDAQAAVAAAEERGAAAERQRTADVFASDEGKANPSMAAWMLQHNAAAPATAIVAAMAAMPKPAAEAAAPAAPAASAAPTPPAAITTPLEQTPPVVVGPEANNGDSGGPSQKDIDASWDNAISAASAGNVYGGEIAPGVPRTGN